MSAAFSIILPHRRNPGNDAALRICLDCLVANTRNDFILLMDAAYDAPLYGRVNAMVVQAMTTYCVYWSSDFFSAPGWDVPMLEACDADTIVTNVLVEPGAIAMHAQNLHMDFGRTPESFNRPKFEAWAANDAPMLDGDGWFAPYMFHTNAWVDAGGLETGLTGIDGFTGADMNLFTRWRESGKRIKRVQSYTYHLQRWSDEKEHEKRA